MKTICPLLLIGGAIAVANNLSTVTDFGDCAGPRCQLWDVCRKPNQCPECGRVSTPNKEHGGFYCPEHGWFNKKK